MRSEGNTLILEFTDSQMKMVNKFVETMKQIPIPFSIEENFIEELEKALPTLAAMIAAEKMKEDMKKEKNQTLKEAFRAASES